MVRIISTKLPCNCCHVLILWIIITLCLLQLPFVISCVNSETQRLIRDETSSSLSSSSVDSSSESSESSEAPLEIKSLWIGIDVFMATTYAVIGLLAGVLLSLYMKSKRNWDILAQIYLFMFLSCSVGATNWTLKAINFSLLERAHRIFEAFEPVLFFSTFLRLILFWAQVYYRASGSRIVGEKRRKRVTILLWTLTLISLAIITVFLILFQSIPEWWEAKIAFQVTLLVIRTPLSIILVFGFIYYYVKLKQVMKKSAKYHSRGRKSSRANKKLSIITGVCSITFFTSSLAGLIIGMFLFESGGLLILLVPVFILANIQIPAFVLMLILSLGGEKEKNRKSSVNIEMKSRI